MPDWNPNFPEVLGLEWLTTRTITSRVWAGSPVRDQRLPSTATETINALHASVTVNPLVKEDTRTVIDVIEEGNEVVPLFEPRGLPINSDVTINGWTTDTGATSNLFQAIDENVTRWPGPAQSTWIQNVNGFQDYEGSVDASDFAAAGALENCRIGWVEIRAIFGANTGFRKLRAGVRINGVDYQPAGGNLRDVHGFGAPYALWYGEINPATELPWTPADIADFDVGGNSVLLVRSQGSIPSHFPKVYAMRLYVWIVPTENRAAVGVWRRPEDLTESLVNAETDALLSMPAGTAGWSKASARNYLYAFRQSVSPALYGAVNADDVRWNGAVQELGPVGQPPNKAFPLHSSGVAPAPSGILCTDLIAHDKYGRSAAAFDPRYQDSYGLVLERSDGAPSIDSQPYRLDLTDREFVTATQKVGQRVTMPSAQSYLGVRLPIIPPRTEDSTLTVAVHRITDGVQIGGTFTITADAARALPGAFVNVPGYRAGIRYVTGFLSSGASLSSGIAYEIRLTSTATDADQWIAFVPDASLGPEASFGGTTDGAFIGATHHSDRDLCVNLIRQPDPPTGLTAAIINVPIITFAPDVTTVEHVEVSWTLPATGMGALFSHYELERQLDGGPWHRIANLNVSSLDGFEDHEVPRDTEAIYRVRAVGLDGRISTWAASAGVTPTAPGAILILTSNHRPDLECVYAYDAESSHPILSTEGDEFVAIHGADYQVVFMEDEDRGIGWRTRITINQLTLQGKGGQYVFKPLTDIIRSIEVPYVCALDNQGTGIFGHVTVTEVLQQQPLHIYSAQIDVVPTNTEPVPVEVGA